MIIDFHTHVFPDSLAQKAIAKLKEHTSQAINYTDGTATGLLRSMDASGIDFAVTLPIATKIEQVVTINNSCAKTISQRLIAFGTLHPAQKSFEKEISGLVNSGVKGIKLHPEYQDFYVDDKKHFPMYEALSASNLIVVFHAGKDPGPFTSDHCLPAALKKVHTEFPRLRIVASHLGGWKVWPQVEETLAGLPIFLETSAVADFIEPKDALRIIRKHGCDRIMFGTDSPWFDQRTQKEWVEKLPLSSDEIEGILSKNAEGLLGMKSSKRVDE